MNIAEMTVAELEQELKSIKSRIVEIDYELYDENFDDKISKMKYREATRYINDLTDERYRLKGRQDVLASEIRRKRLSRLESFNSDVLNFGAYTDVHTPKIKPGAKGHFSAIRGITL